MIVPQSIQILLAYIYVWLFFGMKESCQNKLQTDAPGLWIIANIHMITSCIFLLVIIAMIVVYVIGSIRRNQFRRNQLRRLQVQELTNNSDPENTQNIV